MDIRRLREQLVLKRAVTDPSQLSQEMEVPGINRLVVLAACSPWMDGLDEALEMSAKTARRQLRWLERHQMVLATDGIRRPGIRGPAPKRWWILPAGINLLLAHLGPLADLP